jgi:hypothetical protein
MGLYEKHMRIDQSQDIVIENDESEEFFSRLESSFAMDPNEMRLSSGMLVGELVENVIARLDRRASSGCTSQSLFYRIRELLAREAGKTKAAIQPTSRLVMVLPKASRRQTISKLEQELGIKIRYFQAPGWMQLITLAMLLLSLVWLFISPGIGIIGMIISLLTISIAHRVSAGLPFETLGQFIDKIWTDNLVRLQRNEESINHKEIERVLINVVCDLHGIERRVIDLKRRLVFL